MPAIAQLNPPKSIQQALSCLWLSIGLNILNIVLVVVGIPAAPYGTASIPGAILNLIVLMNVVSGVSAGKKWGKWLFATIVSLGLLVFVYLLAVSPEEFKVLTTIHWAFFAAQAGLSVYVIFLLFTSSSNIWFESRIDRD